MTESNDPQALNGSAIQVEQPPPQQITAEQAYRRASARLRRLHAALVQREQEFKVDKAAGDIAALQSDLSALVSMLLNAKVFAPDDFYLGAALVAEHRAAKVEAELATPQIVVPE